MTPLVQVAADLLVAVLLVATIVSSLRLSRRVAVMKADESAMRGAVAELVAATASAERAIAGLREAALDSERTLAERLRAADHRSAALAEQVAAGEAVLSQVERVAALSRRRSGNEAGLTATAQSPSSPDDALHATLKAARDVAARAARRLEGRAA